MIKIERIAEGTEASYTRDGAQSSLHVGQLLYPHEFDTVVITAGEILYSVDETEVVTLVPAKVEQVQPPVKKPEPTKQEK